MLGRLELLDLRMRALVLDIQCTSVLECSTANWRHLCMRELVLFLD